MKIILLFWELDYKFTVNWNLLIVCVYKFVDWVLYPNLFVGFIQIPDESIRTLFFICCQIFSWGMFWQGLLGKTRIFFFCLHFFNEHFAFENMINVNKLSFNSFSLLGKAFFPSFLRGCWMTGHIWSRPLNVRDVNPRKWLDRPRTNCHGDWTCPVILHPRSFLWQERLSRLTQIGRHFVCTL